MLPPRFVPPVPRSVDTYALSGLVEQRRVDIERADAVLASCAAECREVALLTRPLCLQKNLFQTALAFVAEPALLMTYRAIASGAAVALLDCCSAGALRLHRIALMPAA